MLQLLNLLNQLRGFSDLEGSINACILGNAYNLCMIAVTIGQIAFCELLTYE
jgi:hypothetical protein